MTLWLRLRAPFAAFRPLQAGIYRTTTRTLPYSAAYGLLMNFAGIETRQPGNEPVTQTRAEVPCVRIALGNRAEPEVATLYQQLHGYPVGTSGEDLRHRSSGQKFWIAPVRREILIGLDAILGVEAEPSLLDQIRSGLNGQHSRYGLPFAGENNFLFDDIVELARPLPTFWFEQLGPDSPVRRSSCRLTVGISRADSSRTTMALVAPTTLQQEMPPDAAWIWVPRAPEAGAA